MIYKFIETFPEKAHFKIYTKLTGMIRTVQLNGYRLWSYQKQMNDSLDDAEYSQQQVLTDNFFNKNFSLNI